jgi:serine/threonine protein kinase
MEPLGPADPVQVGPYRLVGRLGEGGMGRVLLSRSPGGRPVAVKMVRPEYAADSRFRQRFAAEVEAARRVGGFFTAHVVDAGPDDNPPWLVTAYVAGPSLQTAYASTGHFRWRRYGPRGGTRGGADGHPRVRVVHRDLKPSNIIIASDGPRVIDFGIARTLEMASLTSRAWCGNSVLHRPASCTIRPPPPGPELARRQTSRWSRTTSSSGPPAASRSSRLMCEHGIASS